MTPAVFLDRDDTLLRTRGATSHLPHPGDLFDPALVELLPGVAQGCAALARAGLALVVISNQGAVAHGRCTLADIEATNDRMRELLRQAAGVELAGVYFSTSRPGASVARFAEPDPWRKPEPGMLLAAAAELNLNLPHSWLIGDAARDVEAGIRAGLAPQRCILIGPDGVPDFSAAAARVLAGHRVE